MTIYPNPVTVGTINAGATVIQADVGGGINQANLQSVTLTTNYTRTPPPGFPVAPPGGRPYAAIAAMVGLISSGTTIIVPVPEGAALVSAGAATSNGLIPAGKAGG